MKIISLVLLSLALSTVAFADCCQGHGKDGKKAKAQGAPLEVVSTDSLREAFNRESDSVRVVSLMSPSCGDCGSSPGVLKSVFKGDKTKSLRGFVIWGESAAGGRVSDKRVVVQAKEGESGIAGAFRSMLKLEGDASEVYMVYAAGTKWEGAEPPAPAYWTHASDAASEGEHCANAPLMAKRLGTEIKKISSKKI